MYPCTFSRVFGWVKTHGQCSVEFEETGSEIWVMVRTWSHIPPCFFCGVEPIHLQYYPGGYKSGESSRCCWSRCICCVSARTSACSGRSFCKLFGKWVPCQARRVPNIWSPADEALTPADRCVCVWEPGPVLNDRVCGERLGGRRDSGLVGVSSSVAESHRYKLTLHARPSRCGGKFRWGMDIRGIIPERGWPQRWWRWSCGKVFHFGRFFCVIWM